MDPGARERLIRERLGGLPFAAFFRAVRARLEAAGPEGAHTVTLRGLGEDERRAVADLHGWRTVPSEGTRVSLAGLDALLRQSAVAAGLVEVLEALGGPIADRRRERDAAMARERRLWAEAEAHPAVAARPELRVWIDELRRRGMLRRVARASHLEPAGLLLQAVETAARLPARGVPLSVLAAETTGDAHALDPGRPLAALALRAAARVADWARPPSGALGRRRLWAEVGVLCDPLSAQVLVLGLRPSGGELLARQLADCADAGEPRRVTLRELTRSPLALAPATPVFVCENPVVAAAAADRLGPSCAPLVCVEGVPSTAALHLMRAVAGAGGALRFHADFDWPGLGIGNLLAAQLPATPWRFGAADYTAALAALPSGASPLGGRPVRAAWDGGLATAMRAAARAVFEEQVLETLLSDLGG